MPPAAENRVLAALTRAEREALAPHVEPVALPRGMTLMHPAEPVTHVVLPASGLVSLMVELPDGARAEAGMIGAEGVIGLPALLGEPNSAVHAVMRVGGHGHRIALAVLRPLVETSPNLREVTHRVAATAIAQAAIGAACNASHTLEQRAARWLLSATERAGPGVPVTQDDLATMLGARRPTVNAVLLGFRGKGLIRQARGTIEVADRAGLRAFSCPCHLLSQRLAGWRGAGATAAALPG
jgi:CRP-like cAMP-binding protein